MFITADTLTNTSTILATGNLTIDAGTLTNEQRVAGPSGQQRLQTGGILAGGEKNWIATTTTNNGALAIAGSTVAAGGNDTLSAGGSLTITTGGVPAPIRHRHLRSIPSLALPVPPWREPIERPRSANGRLGGDAAPKTSRQRHSSAAASIPLGSL